MSILICRGCDGTGEVREDVGTHQSEYEYHTCSRCKGSGKVIVQSYSYSVPFGTNEKLIHDADYAICKIIQTLELKAR